MTTKILARIAVLLLVVLGAGMAAPSAGATSLPAARAFTASFRTVWFDAPDVLLVKVYAADHRSGITYTCTAPTESTTFTASGWKETWSGPACRGDRGPSKAVAASFVRNITGDSVLYVNVAGFQPTPSHTYRYKCVAPTETFTDAPTWFGNTYAAVRPCPVG